MKIPLFQDKTPTEPGYYLFRGAFSETIDLIHVLEYPEKSAFGITWKKYLGVSAYRGKNVKGLIGFFSEKLEFD